MNQTWECDVSMPSQHIETVTVQAYSSSDAITKAESMTGGECFNVVALYDSDSQDVSTQTTGTLVLIAILVFLVAWKWVLLLSGLVILSLFIYYALH